MYDFTNIIKKICTIIGILLLSFVVFNGVCSIYRKYFVVGSASSTVDQQLSAIKIEADNIRAEISTTGKALRESEERSSGTIRALQDNERETRESIKECERLIADCERILAE